MTVFNHSFRPQPLLQAIQRMIQDHYASSYTPPTLVISNTLTISMRYVDKPRLLSLRTSLVSFHMMIKLSYLTTVNIAYALMRLPMTGLWI